MIRLYAFEMEFRCNGERKTITMVSSTEDGAREDLHRTHLVDAGTISLISKKPA